MLVRSAHSYRRLAASARWARLRGPGAPSLRHRAAGPALLLPSESNARLPGVPSHTLLAPGGKLGVPLGKPRLGGGPEPALPACASSSLGVTCVEEAAVPSCAAQEWGERESSSQFSRRSGVPSLVRVGLWSVTVGALDGVSAPVTPPLPAFPSRSPGLCSLALGTQLCSW